MRFSKLGFLFFGLFVIATLSCNKWNDHTAVTELSLNDNLSEYIGRVPELTKFAEYLAKTGLDKEIASSKNYTVWAPSNTALNALPADVVNDTARLKAFLLNHISGQLYFSRMGNDSMRVPMLNGKRLFFAGKKLEDANVITSDTYVRNGVLHIIDKAISPLQSVWEFIGATKEQYAQNAYISTLNYQAQDPAVAVLDSINPLTGQPVYKPNTGIVQINTYRTKIYEVANEDSLYTYVLLTNTAFTAEGIKLRPYFQSADPAITNANASWAVVKDFAIKGLYKPENLPAALLSKFGVRVNMNKNGIVETRRLSNGIVYIMNEALTAKEEKIPVYYLQGERPDSLSSYLDRYITKIFYRERNNPTSGTPFKDIYLNLGSSGLNYYVDYFTNDLYTLKYRVYWVALNDRTISGQGDDPYGTDSTLQQILRIGANNVPFTPAFSVQVPVKPYDYSEVYLGEYTNPDYNFQLQRPLRLPDGSDFTFNPATRRLRLQAPASTGTGIPANLTLDYLKFVPVF
ncbi:fasciclin domain-containing protein [Segetibacter sp. 3557_3]|uniref:fasciclin domain-containing protein n=1 Tax=Segetibacter sp. 3557_3 TaxID=2547429 RepID=UPI001405548B|nr:fasciclin domain-containing protein [Segetibacter sp. 3557_3]